MFTSGIREREAELFPTDAQIAACLWDGLNYVQSNGPHIQCYLQIPLELPPYRRYILYWQCAKGLGGTMEKTTRLFSHPIYILVSN